MNVCKDTLNVLEKRLKVVCPIEYGVILYYYDGNSLGHTGLARLLCWDIYRRSKDEKKLLFWCGHMGKNSLLRFNLLGSYFLKTVIFVAKSYYVCPW